MAGGAGRRRLLVGGDGNAIAGGVLIGWTIENMPLESLGMGGWLRSLALAGVALLSAAVVSAGAHARRGAAALFAHHRSRPPSASAIRWRWRSASC